MRDLRFAHIVDED